MCIAQNLLMINNQLHYNIIIWYLYAINKHIKWLINCVNVDLIILDDFCKHKLKSMHAHHSDIQINQTPRIFNQLITSRFYYGFGVYTQPYPFINQVRFYHTK